jgi:hypothetical protein
MSVLLTYIVLEGIILYTLNKANLTEQQLIRRWKGGNLSYADILVLTHHKKYFLLKLNRHIRFGSHPGLFKKDD